MSASISSPPNRALVLSVDEKSQIQALDPRTAGSADDAWRAGAPDPLLYPSWYDFVIYPRSMSPPGFVIGKNLYKRHRATEFLDFLKRIDAQVPNGLDVHIIMANYASHKTAAIKAWLARRPLSCAFHANIRLLDQPGRTLVRRTHPQKLRRGVHTSTRQLEADIRSFIERHNENPRPYKWVKSADEILSSVKRFCQKAS